MLTKKQLIEHLKNVPDDALIGILATLHGNEVNIFWRNKDGDLEYQDLIPNAPFIPLCNRFNFEDLKKHM